MRQPDTAVHCFKLQLAIHGFAQHDCARTAVAFAATLFRAGGAQIFTQQFKQGAGRWYIGKRNDLSTLYEPDGMGVLISQRCHLNKAYHAVQMPCQGCE